ncbi:taurine ABC transporter permease TauC [Psychrobacter sp. TAE2020]|nr:taurine ABC transporter permease TauC [Psychrobacter sp. TAE2020]MBU5616944.1 taurine ABC transporter permease TauC [Psychrobacter sp. TAE2020]
MTNRIIHTPIVASKRVMTTHSSPQLIIQKKLFIRHYGLFWGAISILTMGIIWWAVTALEAVPSLFLPAPTIVWHQLLKIATDGYMSASLWQHVFASLGRVLVALFAAILVGVPIGILMGTNRTIKAVFDPLLEFYRPIPPLAYLPLLVIWLGIGEVTKIMLIFLAILAPIIISTLQGISTVNKSRQFAALSLGASRSQLLWHVTLPSALPHILIGIRIGLGVGWSTLVAAELIAATKGVGFMIQSAAQFLATDIVILGIMVIAIIAFALEMILRTVQNNLAPWYGKY